MAEVAWRQHQRLPEKPTPESIDHHSRSERVVPARDRGCQFLAAASVFERDRFAAGEHAQKPPFDQWPFPFNIPADKYIEVLGFGIFHHVERVRWHFVRGHLSVERLAFS